jgi:hypothetical protein
MTVNMKIPEIDKEFFLSLVNEEIEDELTKLNFELIQLMKDEKYDECCYVRDAIKTFILDSSKLLKEHIGGRTQTYYKKFQNQNKEIYLELISKTLEI